MFDNVGGKLKVFANVWFAIGCIAAVVLFFIVCLSTEFGWLLWLPALVGTPLLFWFNSLLIYGFAELIETNCKILDAIDEFRDKQKPDEKPEEANDAVMSHIDS